MIALPHSHPKSVVILAMGRSRLDLMAEVVAQKGGIPWDEVWAINHAGFVYQHALCFAMDDLRQMARGWPHYGRQMGLATQPVLTSRAYPEFPTSVDYPIREVVAVVGDDVFQNTVGYAIGYALWVGVKELWLYGCDFTYADRHNADQGGQAAAYLIGYARGRFGTSIYIPRSSTLLAAHTIEHGRRPLYGYAEQPASLALPPAPAGARLPHQADLGPDGAQATDSLSEATLGAEKGAV